MLLSQTSVPGKGGHLPTEKDMGNGNAPLSGEDESKVVVSEVVVVVDGWTSEARRVQWMLP